MSVKRLGVLDGWRGISILLVLLGHLFPMGLKAWALNGAVAGAGMAIFFTLSGFLITSVLLKGDTIRAFLIHRVMRIVPLAWLAMVLTLAFIGADAALYPPHLLFYANLFPTRWRAPAILEPVRLEMQFYVAVALIVIVATGGRRAVRAARARRVPRRDASPHRHAPPDGQPHRQAHRRDPRRLHVGTRLGAPAALVRPRRAADCSAWWRCRR